MRITKNTDRQLVIVHRPWFLAGCLWAMGLAAVYATVSGTQKGGLAEQILVALLGVGTCFAAWYWFAFLRITFDRDLGQVEHISFRPFGTRWRYLPLDRVKGAVIEASWSDGARLTRLALDTEDGRAQLEYGYGSADRTDLEQAVNEWLSRPV